MYIIDLAEIYCMLIISTSLNYRTRIKACCISRLIKYHSVLDWCSALFRRFFIFIRFSLNTWLCFSNNVLNRSPGMIHLSIRFNKDVPLREVLLRYEMNRGNMILTHLSLWYLRIFRDFDSSLIAIEDTRSHHYDFLTFQGRLFLCIHCIFIFF